MTARRAGAAWTPCPCCENFWCNVMTLNASRRVPEHAKGNAKTPAKDFDWAPLLPVPLEELLEAERIYVALLDPPLNRNLRPALEWMPPAGEGAGH
jgi:hypothetical protein